jgi:hypothetical protein
MRTTSMPIALAAAVATLAMSPVAAHSASAPAHAGDESLVSWTGALDVPAGDLIAGGGSDAGRPAHAPSATQPLASWTGFIPAAASEQTVGGSRGEEARPARSSGPPALASWNGALRSE